MTIDQITNKDLQDLLKQYPDDAIVCIEYCNIRELKYFEEFAPQKHLYKQYGIITEEEA